MISLSGEWIFQTNKTSDTLEFITLPGTIGGNGLGEKITKDTEWFTGLYNPFWYEREEYKSGAGEDFKVPFLAQPRTYYAGKAIYERNFEISGEEKPVARSTGNTDDKNATTKWYLLVELSKWRVSAYIDDIFVGEDESLCAPFLLGPVSLNSGEHHIKIIVDNSMIYPYRPDSHSVSDCLEAGWNGMAGKICLINEEEKAAIEAERKQYAAKHPVSVKVEGRNIVVNKKAEYLRGTHFGGGFHDTVYPPFDRPFWDRLMRTVREWGFNFIRFHSFCPPDAAFAAADEAGVFLQVECGMWNVFGADEREKEAVSQVLDPWVEGMIQYDESGLESLLSGLDYEKAGMFGVLLKETFKILKWFGHHPSFIMLSPTNEPGGEWYGILKKWVIYAKKINSELGYEGRRLFTAQSGWFYDVPPADITGTDYIYFHRSAYGPIHGGMIRNRWGWRGKDYTPSLEGCKLPVLAHEMGQWCSYPDLDVINKFTGGIRGGNYEIFRENAEKNGVLKFNRDFVFASGRAQVRLLKEDFEANFRTPEIVGFEYLDLHDYAGQGTAQVGILDAFLDNKGYTAPEEFTTFNSEIVILARIDGYVYKNTDILKADIEICNFSGKELKNVRTVWKVGTYEDEGSRTALIEDARKGTFSGSSEIRKDGDPVNGLPGPDNIFINDIEPGKNTFIGHIETAFDGISDSTKALLLTALVNEEGGVESINYWDLTIFAQTGSDQGRVTISEGSEENVQDIGRKTGVYFVRTAEEARELLVAGKTVIFSPYLSDMDFECPPLGIRNIFWNAQMGPSWARPLGILIDTESPVFTHFPTEKAGGWEWEDILEHARGFNFDPKYDNIVRVVDDWNRNYPLSLIFEGRVFEGKLLFCSADLSGTFEERPAAFTLKQALVTYAASDDFNPKQKIEWEDVLRHLKPLYKGMDIIQNIKSNIMDISEEELNKLTDINPNIPFRYAPSGFPLCFSIKLKDRVNIERLYVLPIQNDRDFPGVIREYGIRVNGREFRGEWKNGFETQYSEFIGETAKEFEFIVYSTYSMGYATRWYEEKDGYYKRTELEPLQVTAAALGLEYIDLDPIGKGRYRRNDDLFWKGEVTRLGVTIEQ
ncbi:MAG: hypothetical protein K6E85_08085 [Lachnospiraceae bacterium]|nr:hypothetical protein [Lachnospiraceae bacterium]